MAAISGGSRGPPSREKLTRFNGAALSDNGLVAASGVITVASPGEADAGAFVEAFADALSQRHFQRDLASVPA